MTSSSRTPGPRPGMCATASHHFRVDDLSVPPDRTFVPLEGEPCIDEPIARVHTPAFVALVVSSVALGIARGALDDIFALAGGKVPHARRVAAGDEPAVPTRVAVADAELRASRSLLHATAEEIWAAGVDGRPLSLEEIARTRASAAWATERATTSSTRRTGSAAGRPSTPTRPCNAGSATSTPSPSTSSCGPTPSPRPAPSSPARSPTSPSSRGPASSREGACHTVRAASRGGLRRSGCSLEVGFGSSSWRCSSAVRWPVATAGISRAPRPRRGHRRSAPPPPPWVPRSRPFPEQPEGVPWPTEEWAEAPWPAGVDKAAIDAATDTAFNDGGARPRAGRRHRARRCHRLRALQPQPRRRARRGDAELLDGQERDLGHDRHPRARRSPRHRRAGRRPRVARRPRRPARRDHRAPHAAHGHRHPVGRRVPRRGLGDVRDGAQRRRGRLRRRAAPDRRRQASGSTTAAAPPRCWPASSATRWAATPDDTRAFLRRRAVRQDRHGPGRDRVRRGGDVAGRRTRPTPRRRTTPSSGSSTCGAASGTASRSSPRTGWSSRRTPSPAEPEYGAQFWLDPPRPGCPTPSGSWAT